jgi:formate/nitrite transporter
LAYLPPADLSRKMAAIGLAKARLPMVNMFVLGILAGAYIGFGAHCATVVSTGNALPYGLAKVLAGGVFSVGLMLVVIAGAELFTGNNLMTVALCDGRISFLHMLRNWLVVYLGNLVGAVLLAFIVARSSGLLAGPVGGTALNIAFSKIDPQPLADLSHNYAFFFRAIGCNWLVCLAVMLATAAEDISGKIWAIFFPIMTFVAVGFEHCVANMYFIPAGIFAKSFDSALQASGLPPEQLAGVNWTSMWTGNLISVTLGNIVGGGIFAGALYWFVYIRASAKSSE